MIVTDSKYLNCWYRWDNQGKQVHVIQLLKVGINEYLLGDEKGVKC